MPSSHRVFTIPETSPIFSADSATGLLWSRRVEASIGITLVRQKGERLVYGSDVYPKRWSDSPSILRVREPDAANATARGKGLTVA